MYRGLRETCVQAAVRLTRKGGAGIFHMVRNQKEEASNCTTLLEPCFCTLFEPYGSRKMFVVELLLPEGWASGGAVQVSGTKLTGVGFALFPGGSDSPELTSLSNGGETLVLTGLWHP